ncbi:unnamed protein product [Boreogadus saida]
MAQFRDHLQDLYPFFRNSANRTATLKAASLILGVTDLKVKVPVTIQTLLDIREAGQTPVPGSFLSRLHENLEDPDKLGAFEIKHEAERGRRGEDVQDQSREAQWCRFERQVIQPYITGLETELKRRFQELDILGAFHNKSQEELRTLLASEYDEWLDLYPCLSLLASRSESSVNCEQDFSAMNRIKTDLRNRLQGEHLAACLRISINGPEPNEVPYDRALELFFRNPRRIRCSDGACKLCT